MSPDRLHSTKMDCLNTKFRRNLASTGHSFEEQSKNSPQKEFMDVGKMVGHIKQLHEMILP